MRTKGKIASWNDDKGFGFIEPLGGGKRVFIHIKSFARRNRRPAINQVVTYALSTDKQGRPCAVNATLPGDRLTRKGSKPGSLFSITVATIFLISVAVAVFATNAPFWIIPAYLALSLVTYIAYAMDKSAARSGNWRTSEGTLHIFSLIGGWPGALVAQQTLRHKSRKQPFRFIFWLTVMANCGAFAWLLTPEGAAFLNSIIPA
jgi:uncharacterized membrane protein YsdA (DUF1294 family)/cold shock CspA family protein